jgi:uncharacterized tellurite resistance protein B-like protein
MLVLLLTFAIVLFFHLPLAIGLLAGAILLVVGWRIMTFAAGPREVHEAAAAADMPAERPRAGTRRARQGGLFWRVPGSGNPDLLGELVYVGQGLSSVAGHKPEPALIDPSLDIDTRVRECRTDRLNYGPSYSTCSPQARAGYLTWLAGDRSDPEADIGYVFLYFYGLERRALWDTRTDPAAAAERPALIAEVDRLLLIYGGNASFHRYASALRDVLAALELPAGAYLQSPRTHPGEPLTFGDRVALGMCAADRAPLPAVWAYQWVLHESGIALGSVAQRVPGELEALFAEIYRSRHGEGLVLPEGRAKLRVEHRPASPSFVQGVKIVVALPDVVRQEKTLLQLAGIASEARERLARYSRMVGKDPSVAGTAQGLLELPVSLWPVAQRRPLEALAEEVVHSAVPLELPFARLARALPELGALTRNTHRALCELLAGLGLGMEPDPRFGGALPALGTHVVLFADDSATAASAGTARYAGFAAMMQLAAVVASADGELGEEERAVMLAQIHASPGLAESERRRLDALLRLTRLEPPRTARLKRRLAALDARGREALGDFLVKVAGADHSVTPEEIRALQSSFGLLGLDAGDVFARVHAAEMAGQPVEGEPRVPRRRRAQPGPAAAPGDSRKLSGMLRQPSATGGISLDTAKVARLQADSEVVASLLASVFAEEPPEEATPDAASSAGLVAEPDVLGLDAPASRFLQALLGRPRWSRAELAALARERGLPLDGVLERLNEAVYEKLDAPLFEDGDPLILNPEARAAFGAGTTPLTKSAPGTRHSQ